MTRLIFVFFTICLLPTAAFALNYNVPRATVIPSIDGTMDDVEWVDSVYISMIYPDIVTSPKEGSVVDTNPPDDKADYSLHWFVKWDENYLYVAARVYDDIFVADDRKDEPQICFNMLNNHDALYLTEAIVWNLPANGPIYTNTSEPSALAPDHSNIAGSVLADGYMIEVRLAWEDLDPNHVYQPISGHIHGFGLACQDHDAGGLRETFMLDMGKGAFTMHDVTTWNTVTLTEDLVCGDWGYQAYDVDKNCRVDLDDFALLTQHWLRCTDPAGEGCVNMNLM